MIESFRVLVYKQHSDLVLLDDLTGLTSLSYSSALHGGYHLCEVTVPMRLGNAWLYLQREGQKGRHFMHLEVREGAFLRWEGRIMECGVTWGTSMQGLKLTAMGYWSSMRDQRITTVNYSSGSHTVDSIIKAMLTDKCPDISSDQANVDAVAGAVNLTLDVDKYAQDHIIQALAPLGDTSDNQYYFSVYDNRVPFYKARSDQDDDVEWEIPLTSIRTGAVTQGAQHLRNGADAYDGTTRTAAGTDADSRTLYPSRDQVVSVPTGTTAARALDARDRFISERQSPQQKSRFVVNGPIFRRKAHSTEPGGRSAIRAGQVVKIIDLIPGGAASPVLDNLRTFFVVQAKYDASRDEVAIIPDRPPSTLETLLARTGIETTR